MTIQAKLPLRQINEIDNPIRIAARVDSFEYPDQTRALTDISLDLRKGEFAGLLGANGSGKTTLLKAMDGLLRNFHGQVLLDGQEVRKLSPREIYRKVGLVFQNPDEQLFGATVFEDVAFGPLNMGLEDKEIRRRVGAALRAVEVEPLREKPIHNLSYGQKKRVCIAGLLAMGQEILLLDEPTAGLDPMGEYGMMEILTRLNREEGVTMLMATHSVDMVPLFLDSLYIMSRGQIIRRGNPEEVFTAPGEMQEAKLRLPYVADLIHQLKHEDRLPFQRVPLTVGEARREILKLYG